MAERLQTVLTIFRRRDLEARLKLSRSTIYDKINPGSPRYDAAFPKPIRLGNGSAVGWIEGEVESWLRSRIEASLKDADARLPRKLTDQQPRYASRFAKTGG